MESVEQQSRFGVAGGQHVMGTGDRSWQASFSDVLLVGLRYTGSRLLGGTGAQETWLKGCRPSIELAVLRGGSHGAGGKMGTDGQEGGWQ